MISEGLTNYDDAILEMERIAGQIATGEASERVWLVQHPPIYTAGTSAKAKDLLNERFPVTSTGRGGEYTYHGPGQRIVYVLLDLKRRRQDLRAFVAALEALIISALAELGVKGERREDRVGVWVRRPERSFEAEDKIAAIGIRVRRWVTFHGISINVDPELEHFNGIVPCGVANADYGVTSLEDLGLPYTMYDLDIALRRSFDVIFGDTLTIDAVAAG